MMCRTPLDSRMSCCVIRAELTKSELDVKVMVNSPPWRVRSLVPLRRAGL